MAYGIEIYNTSGRVLFSTNDNYPLMVANSPTSTGSYGTALPSYSIGQTVLARPQDGESGVIASINKKDFSGIIFFGEDSYMQSWGAAPGTKYTVAKRSYDVVTTPSTSGYGIEVYDTAGKVTFTSNTSRLVTIEAIIQLERGEKMTYYNPNGGFNNLYVDVVATRLTYFDYLGQVTVGGCYAYFNNTAESISVYNDGNYTTSTVNDPKTYLDREGSIGFAPTTANVIIYRVNGA